MRNSKVFYEPEQGLDDDDDRTELPTWERMPRHKDYSSQNNAKSKARKTIKSHLRNYRR